MRIFDVRMNVCWDVELHAGLNPAAETLCCLLGFNITHR